MMTAVMFVEIWNWRNLRTASLTQRPHMIALTIEAKLSSIRMMSEASLAISVPAIPTEDRAFHDDASSGIDTTLSGNRASGEDVVSGTHLDGDTRVMAGSDSLADTITKGIFDTGDGHRVMSWERSS